MLAVIINQIKGHLRVLYESILSWLCLTQLGTPLKSAHRNTFSNKNALL